MSIAIVNPLPTALRHYSQALEAVLQAAGHSTYDASTPTIEGASGGLPAVRAARALTARRRLGKVPDDAIVVWPAFGLLDPITFMGRQAHTWLIVHDAEPLRRQFGMGAWAGGLGRRALSERITVVVHSEPARRAMTDRGWPVVAVPHPVMPPTLDANPRGTQVRVLGQFKPARSLEPLEILAADPSFAGRLEIGGRGWPTVPGWQVDPDFLTEDEMDRRIREAAAVVLPYDRYFQSGVAVRCLEQHTPVVGRVHPFLSDLFGSDWPGMVVGDDWSSVVTRAMHHSSQDLVRRHEQYWSRCVAAWRALLTRVGEDEAVEGQ